MRLRRSAGLVLIATAAGGGLMALVYGAAEGLLTALLLALMGVPVLAVAYLVARHRRRLGRLSWQLGLGVVIAIAVDLVSIQLVAMVLFVSAHDAFTLALLLAFAGVLSGYVAWSLTDDVAKDVARLREAVAAVEAGSREQRVNLGDADELSQLAMEINRMTVELERREAERDASEVARRDLIAGISHDLRTPLNALRLVADAINDGLVDERTLRRYLDQVPRHLHSLDTLINDLFELARIEAGDIQWPFEDLRLDQLMRETLEGMSPLAQRENIRLELSTAPDLPRVRANPEKIQRVLFNLVENALSHTPREGRVSIRAAPNGRDVEVEVADTGRGISSPDLGRVFEPLFRGGEHASRPRHGAGLGLPIARSIIEAHSGHIDIAESSPNGTRIRFTLPRASPDDDEERQPTGRPNEVSGDDAG